MIQNLITHVDLNGCIGIKIGEIMANDRYQIRIFLHNKEENISIKIKNIRNLPEELTKFQNGIR